MVQHTGSRQMKVHQLITVCPQDFVRDVIADGSASARLGEMSQSAKSSMQQA